MLHEGPLAGAGRRVAGEGLVVVETTVGGWGAAGSHQGSARAGGERGQEGDFRVTAGVTGVTGGKWVCGGVHGSGGLPAVQEDVSPGSVLIPSARTPEPLRGSHVLLGPWGCSSHHDSHCPPAAHLGRGGQTRSRCGSGAADLL